MMTSEKSTIELQRGVGTSKGFYSCFSTDCVTKQKATLSNIFLQRLTNSLRVTQKSYFFLRKPLDKCTRFNWLAENVLSSEQFSAKETTIMIQMFRFRFFSVIVVRGYFLASLYCYFSFIFCLQLYYISDNKYSFIYLGRTVTRYK